MVVFVEWESKCMILCFSRQSVHSKKALSQMRRQKRKMVTKYLFRKRPKTCIHIRQLSIFLLFIVHFFLFTVDSNDCIVKGSVVINKLIAFYLFVDCIHWLPLYYSLGLFQIKREKEKKCRIDRPRNPITIRYQYFDVVKWNGYM